MPDHTVPYGTVLWRDAPRYFAPGYDLLSLWDEKIPRRGFDASGLQPGLPKKPVSPVAVGATEPKKSLNHLGSANTRPPFCNS